jgi:hypothetical protein
VIQILAGQPSPRRGGDKLRFVALLTGDPTVLSRKREARLAVIYSFTFGFPVDECEIDSIVIGVTPSALFAASAICPHPKHVHAALLCNPIADFGMAFEAFKLLSAPTQPMAFATVCRT